ncbi:hypothetical protein BDP55DRAFT_628331 [Colletotrichum godetiae]|uniref:Uncharacterized protein n=1 Tax=Colletotrichum godetiae TaxID=1209918 RepID=A0AAJ0ASX1_9PEZI|nr:uncharacterized protein BDP55DRAFT_628331 [Colletotrichum godetiae]KAK1689781.1 hypothetical protein BDP55DRAFT_628331 [Colletotrichum godetiae]
MNEWRVVDGEKKVESPGAGGRSTGDGRGEAPVLRNLRMWDSSGGSESPLQKSEVCECEMNGGLRNTISWYGGVDQLYWSSRGAVDSRGGLGDVLVALGLVLLGDAAVATPMSKYPRGGWDNAPGSVPSNQPGFCVCISRPERGLGWVGTEYSYPGPGEEKEAWEDVRMGEWFGFCVPVSLCQLILRPGRSHPSLIDPEPMDANTGATLNAALALLARSRDPSHPPGLAVTDTNVPKKE